MAEFDVLLICRKNTMIMCAADINILIACEESQAECMAFRKLGANAFSCDLQKCNKNGNPGWHIVGDCTPYISGCTQFVTQIGECCTVDKWHLIIAHPPCTYLTKVGSPWLYKDADYHISYKGKVIEVNFDRWRNLKDARKFFFKCLDAKADFVAVENPIPMAIAQLPPASTYVCPSWFGFKYTKKTLYWLKNLPPIMAKCENVNTKSLARCSRGKYRSRTAPQLADAIAEQWLNYILDKYNKKI